MTERIGITFPFGSFVNSAVYHSIMQGVVRDPLTHDVTQPAILLTLEAVAGAVVEVLNAVGRRRASVAVRPVAAVKR